MGLISPTTPTIGAARGDEEVDSRSAIIALLNEFNGNIDDANIKTGANINGSKLLNATVTAGKIEAQQAWQTVALGNKFTGNLAYYKDSLGIVHLRGDDFVSSGVGGATIATLPAGYRPGTTQRFPVACDSGTFSFTIATNGVVTAAPTGVGLTWSFGAAHFRAEN